MSKRHVIVLPFAALATGGVFMLMTALIDAQWVPQDTAQDLKYEINPVVEDINPFIKTIDLKIIDHVEIPPPPPLIDRQPRIRPSEPLPTYTELIPIIPNPDISDLRPVIYTPDSEEKPLVRVPPVMPSRAERSGHCIVRFEVNAEGAPYNISTPYCSQPIFTRPTIKAVGGWRYRPAVSGGAAISSRSIETRVSFNLNDENGRLIPE
ncbi:energy transducer TonB [Robiginitomaculum antarcticum]|uniref:energy transducer TonB n=1 Tax=Robiginitomaculum antarcticum TaxID=437507 RepID=UPI000374C40C|nr:energy transducer TonB [Robiginitomaculum antarcticum]